MLVDHKTWMVRGGLAAPVVRTWTTSRLVAAVREGLEAWTYYQSVAPNDPEAVAQRSGENA